MKNSIWEMDKKRYGENMFGGGGAPLWQKYYRKAQMNEGIVKCFYKSLFKIIRKKYHVEINSSNQIGAGLYIGHPYGITINSLVVIGSNCNIHKGVTIGQENRGNRKGVPTIGDYVYIGVNATIVGNITIGNDVLIAPNTYVNCDVPAHSIVFGNPCIIKSSEHATMNYIINTI